ncbi:MAG: endolytic transglycosylase MltG [Oscillospiraceae bacterium]|nr:endolytic transglycosylase MltG [Oscillospiraceae bacterium]
MPESQADIAETPAPATAGGKAAQKPPRVVMRRRPRSFVGFMVGIVYVIGVLVVSFVLGSNLWAYARDILAIQKTPVSATIEYTPDMTIDDLAVLLKEKGLIEYDWLFKLYCGFSDAEAKMAPGKYDLVSTDYRALVYSINERSEFRTPIMVTLREGLTAAQMFDLLAENEVADVEELEEAAATTNWRYGYLKNFSAVPGRVEGYLFPNTYEFLVNESPVAVLQKMVVEFDNRFTADMRRRADTMGYTMHEILTVASMIEQESGADMEERRNIASVIYNRLENRQGRWETRLLQIDATLLYYMEGRREITQEDMETDNPYNTYIHPGLPPGPICNPGIDSINAALRPNSTNYFYYLLNDENETEFFTNYNDFLEARQSYDRYD